MSAHQDNMSWRTRWVMRRNAIIGSARFQRWASRTPVIRAIARRRAAAQFDLVAGFVYSQILSVCVTLGLIEYLTGALRTLPDIANHIQLGESATDRLLRAAAALRLTESPQAGLWTLGEAGAPLSANPGAMAMIRHHRLLYQDLADPVALLKADRAAPTALSTFWSYAAAAHQPTDVADYSALMAATQPMVAQQIIGAYDFSRHRRMLDIGGGTGAFARAVSAVAPGLSLGIFDLPAVLAVAADRGDCASFSLHPGSFREDMPPTGYDLITLVRIAHDHDDAVVRALLENSCAALPPGGRLLIVEPLAETASAPAMGDAYFGLYLWAMGSGRPRSASELTAMIKAAGFARVDRVPTALPIITSALVATK
jgi:demethylspheroidene O-methyltransferase